MKIVVDAYGGDNAPLEIMKGAVAASEEYGVSIALTGRVGEMRRIAEQGGFSLDGLDLVEAPQIMDMHDDAKMVIRQKADSSMGAALRMVAGGEADACVSAGPTGAYLMGATMIVKRIKGVKRPALGAVMPGLQNPYILVDCGANAEVRPEMLDQFGLMGSVYMKNVLGVKSPRVGLANNGAEDSKGTGLQREAYAIMRENPLIHFIGNVEGRDIPEGAADVVVADGFTGNLILKTVEGMGGMFAAMLREMLLKNAATKTGALFLRSGIRDFRKKMDYTEYGGAPLIGLSRPVVKAHGSSNAKALKNAVRQAMQWSGAGVTEEIANAAAKKTDEE